MTRDVRAHLIAALDRDGRPSSDYDLNADVDLPEGRILRPASVLIAICDGNVLLTKRASTLKHHPGQVAFAGGKVDETDTGVIDAALREAREEIGLPSGHVDVLGTLPPHETVTGFSITPVVALCQRFEPVIEAGEVDEMFEVPLAHVTDISAYGVQSRRWRGQRRHYFAVPWGPYYIWGATARILRALADRMDDANHG